jgi:hypothetical protein
MIVLMLIVIAFILMFAGAAVERIATALEKIEKKK